MEQIGEFGLTALLICIGGLAVLLITALFLVLWYTQRSKNGGDIEKLLQDLQSDNPQKRLDACERLLFSVGIPDNAIEALSKATKDSDPKVAEMARKALDVQLHDRSMNKRYGETGSRIP